MPAQPSIHAMLAAGRHRLSRGCAPEVAELILKNPRLAAHVIECLWDDDPGVANRAADALERLSAHRPRLLDPWKRELLGLLAESMQNADPLRNKVRWNLSLVIPRLQLTVSECRRAAEALRAALDDRGSIVKTLALQGLADLTRQDPSLLAEVLDLLRVLGRSGTPAMRARSRHLLRMLDPSERPPSRRRISSPGQTHPAHPGR